MSFVTQTSELRPHPKVLPADHFVHHEEGHFDDGDQDELGGGGLAQQGPEGDEHCRRYEVGPQQAKEN